MCDALEEEEEEFMYDQNLPSIYCDTVMQESSRNLQCCIYVHVLPEVDAG